MKYDGNLKKERTKWRTINLIGDISKAQIIFLASDVSKMMIKTTLKNILLKKWNIF
jgi:hypothetical protein